MPVAGVLFAESVHAGDFHMSPRTDPFHKILYVQRGAISYLEKNRRLESASTGTVLIIPAGIEHQIADEQPSTLFLLCLDRAYFARDPELPALWKMLAERSQRRLALSRPTRHQVELIWRRTMLEQIRQRTGGITAVRTLAAQLLVTLIRLPVVKISESPRTRVTAVAREMEVSFYEEWNQDRAAIRAGVSRRHFSMLFRKTCGRTFWEHLTDLRLTHAAQLLRNGGHSVTGAVFACGFGDVSQFYRLFRARYGLPPKQWALTANPARTRNTPGG